jgi:cell division protein FtsW
MLVGIHEGVLRLHPASRVALSPAPQADLPPACTGNGCGATPGPGRGWRWWACTWRPRGRRMRERAGTPHPLCPQGRRSRCTWAPPLRLPWPASAMLLAQRSGGAPGVPGRCCWAGRPCGTGSASRAPGRGAIGVLLLAAGLLLQLELGIGAPDTSWLRHFQKTAAGGTLGLGLPAAPSCGAKPPRCQAGVESLLLLLAGAALARCCCRSAGATRPACSTCSRWNSPSWR